jgi:hypothetical protein
LVEIIIGLKARGKKVLVLAQNNKALGELALRFIAATGLQKSLDVLMLGTPEYQNIASENPLANIHWWYHMERLKAVNEEVIEHSKYFESLLFIDSCSEIDEGFPACLRNHFEGAMKSAEKYIDLHLQESTLVTFEINAQLKNTYEQLKYTVESFFREVDDEEIVHWRNQKSNLIDMTPSLSQGSNIASRINEVLCFLQQLNLPAEERGNFVERAKIIFATTNQAASNVFDEIAFNVCIVDEAATFSDVYTCAILKPQLEQLILAGDCKQLPVFACAETVIKRGFQKSLFERLNDCLQNEGSGIKRYLLSTQYRMHPSILSYPNVTFYEGRIINGVKVENAVVNNKLKPLPPVAFIDASYGEEVKPEHSKSYFNEFEANACVEVLDKILETYAGQSGSIGIICFYKEQISKIFSILKASVQVTKQCSELNKEANVAISLFLPSYKNSGFDLTLLTVDASQGKEFSFTIISAVKTKSVAACNSFINDPRR